MNILNFLMSGLVFTARNLRSTDNNDIIGNNTANTDTYRYNPISSNNSADNTLLNMVDQYQYYDGTSKTSHSPDDYSNAFLSEFVWTTPENSLFYTGFPVTLPYLQSSGIINVTYNFAPDTTPEGREEGCDRPFSPLMRDLQKEILNDYHKIVPNLNFTEVNPDTPAHITFSLCSNLDVSHAYFPNRYGSNVHIANIPLRNINYFGISLENILEMYNAFPYGILVTLYDQLKHLYSHEALHAIVLEHSHNYAAKGEPEDQVNTRLLTDYTARTSVMSYHNSDCALNSIYSLPYLKPYMAWEPLPPIRTTPGPVDIINMQYAYNASAPSISYNQTDDTFPCPPKVSQKPEYLSFGLPEFVLLFETQLFIGLAVALSSLFGDKLAKKAKESNNSYVSHFGDITEKTFKTLTPPKQSADATWPEAFRNASNDLIVCGARLAMPLSALVHDITYTTGSAIMETNVLTGSRSIITKDIPMLGAYLLSRGIGFPVSSLYQFAETTQKPENGRTSSQIIVDSSKAIYDALFARTISQRREEFDQRIGENCQIVSQNCQYAFENPLEIGNAIITAGGKGLYSVAENAVRIPFIKPVVNLRGVRHLAVGSSVYNWANKVRPGLTNENANISANPNQEDDIEMNNLSERSISGSGNRSSGRSSPVGEIVKRGRSGSHEYKVARTTDIELTI